MSTAVPATDEVGRDLATAFAWSMAHTVAPEELPFFQDIATDFWKDPQAATAKGGRGESIGFGIDEAMTTTLLLALATPVLKSLATALGNAIQERVTPKVTGWVRRIFGVGPRTADPIPRLSSEQLGIVRSSTLHQALRSGMPGPQAEILADAVVGATVAAIRQG